MRSNPLVMQESVFQEEPLLPLSPTRVIWQGKKMLDFSSQDFLGLSLDEIGIIRGPKVDIENKKIEQSKYLAKVVYELLFSPFHYSQSHNICVTLVSGPSTW